MLRYCIILFFICTSAYSANSAVISSIIVSTPSTFTTSDSNKIVNIQLHFDRALPDRYLLEFDNSDGIDESETSLYLVFRNTEFDFYTPTENHGNWLHVYADSTDSYHSDVPVTVLKIDLTQKVAVKSKWDDSSLTLSFSDKRHYSNANDMYWSLPLTALGVASILFLIESNVLPATQ
ncbi:MAG: hypothetical protein OCC49_04050 [Fibrobacterales bacterium]